MFHHLRTHNPYPMKVFWFFFWFDALMALIPIYFFFVGLADGSITARNGGIWALLLGIIGAVLFGSHWLMQHGHLGWAKGVVIVASVPGWIMLLYLLIILIGKPRWN